MKQIIAQYQDEWDHRGGIYSLAQGVTYWKPPPTVSSVLMQALENDDSYLHTYCPDEGLPELREALVNKIRAENLLGNHNVMVTAGANQAYMNCILTLLGDGEKAIFFRPYYFNHIMAVQLAVGNQGVVLGDCKEDGVPDLDWLEHELASNAGVKLVTITNPCNPTGVDLDQSVLQRAVDLCQQHGKWLVLDCTYEHFQHTKDNKLVFPCFDQDHVIHVFSFSKGYAMAGYRCGYLVVSKKQVELFRQMVKVQDTIPICPSRFSQLAALGALSAGRSWVIDKVNTLETGRQAILEALAPLENVMGGTGAMYVMGKLPPQYSDKDEEVARKLVREFGVAVIPGQFCGFPGWIRVCYSNLDPEQCQLAADRLAAGINSVVSDSYIM
jgi:aspartate/methionine/tyrosine aminotransferase